MDEPLSNLDAKLRNQMRAETIKLRQKINTTFMFVTHDQTEAMTLGDRIVIMKAGFIQQIGTPQMNYFDARLEKDGGTYMVSVGGIQIELSQEKQQNLTAKGVQPQVITLAQGGSALTATVDVSEMMGSEVYLHTNAMGRDVVIIVPTMDLQGNHKDTFARGAEVKFTFSGSVCHLFDGEGKNLEF